MDPTRCVAKLAVGLPGLTEYVEYGIPSTPTVYTDRVEFSWGGLACAYRLMRTGVKLGCTVAAPLGARQFQVNVNRLGGPLVLQPDGSLRSGLLVIPAPVAFGADGVQYAAGGWEQLANGTVLRFAWDDSALPLAAFPYTLGIPAPRCHSPLARAKWAQRLGEREHTGVWAMFFSRRMIMKYVTGVLLLCASLLTARSAYSAACSESPTGQTNCEVFSARDQNVLATPAPNYQRWLANNAAGIACPTPAAGEAIMCDEAETSATDTFTLWPISQITGSMASGGNLTLSSTSHATKGKILFGTSAYDEVTNRLGVGTASPGFPLHVVGMAKFFTGANSIDIGDGGSGMRISVGGGNSLILSADNAISNWPSGNVTFHNASAFTNQARLGVNTLSPGAQLEVDSSNATNIGQIIKGAASQSADLTQWQDSSGNVLNGVNATGIRYSTVQAVTCADSTDGNPGALTIQPTSNVVTITNSDVDGCTITMSETGAVAGSEVRLIVISNAGGNVAFADSAGVSELAGAYNATATQTLSLIYVNSAWHELGRSAN